MESLNFGQSRRESEIMERYVTIRTEYETKMKVELNRARMFFKDQYLEFIAELERKANEVTASSVHW